MENDLSESEMYESIGRKQTELDRLNAEYDRLLSIAAQIASGEISQDRVRIDLAARAWTVVALPGDVAAPAADPAQQLQ